jgi:hypothetical protein
MHHAINQAAMPAACSCGFPRACGGRLSRCLACLRRAVDQQRREREARQKARGRRHRARKNSPVAGECLPASKRRGRAG